MAKWHFWGEKEFSDVYENIYIRAVSEDWLNIVFAVVKEISGLKPLNRKLRILDIGCGEGHTTKQILDRLERPYLCDLLEPNESALAIAEAYLRPENNIGEVYGRSLATFQPLGKYDIVFTSHTNYYWALNEQDYQRQLKKLLTFLTENGKLLILTLPEESDHYKVQLRRIYPVFNYAQYIIQFYRRMHLNIRVKKMKMRMYVGDILSTKKLFDLKVFYRFIHNTDSFPSEAESGKFLARIKKFQKNNYLNFSDYLVVVTKIRG